MILIIDLNWKKDSLGCYEFVAPILAVAEKLDKCRVKHYLDVSKQDLGACDKIILSGTALKDNAFLGKQEKFQWLTQTEKPVFGICAGMEIIGLIFGATLSQSLAVGMTPVSTVMQNPFFSGDFKAYSLHGFCVEPSEQFEVWAKSNRCIQAMKHKEKSIYGVLFHPEVRNQEILQYFVNCQF
jgi:GMP synthase (glutamine-hydrolysing)